MSSPLAEQDRISLSLSLHGLFVDAMAQSVVIEQTLALAAPQHGFAFVPAAALRSPDGRTFVVIGSAGAGKTTLALAGLVAGWRVLADDHLLIDTSGRCLGLPRRMRVYPSTMDLVPGAAARLFAVERRALRLRRLARRLTVGRVGLPVLIPPGRFGHVSPLAWTAPDQIVCLHRSIDTSSARWTTTSAPDAVNDTLLDIATDRARLATVLGEPWRARLRGVRAAESAILLEAWRRIEAGRADVPRSWSPARILAWIAGGGVS